jgi:hypothetical protein
VTILDLMLTVTEGEKFVSNLRHANSTKAFQVRFLQPVQSEP